MEILVVTSKVKGLIKAKAGMNTSAEVTESLTKHIEVVADLAIKAAQNDGRKTVMGRDIQAALNTFAVEGSPQ